MSPDRQSNNFFYIWFHIWLGMISLVCNISEKFRKIKGIWGQNDWNWQKLLSKMSGYDLECHKFEWPNLKYDWIWTKLSKIPLNYTLILQDMTELVSNMNGYDWGFLGIEQNSEGLVLHYIYVQPHKKQATCHWDTVWYWKLHFMFVCWQQPSITPVGAQTQ